MTAPTLYAPPHDASSGPAGSSARPGGARRTAILADLDAAHDVLAGAAKDHWERTFGVGSGSVREGETVTGFLYACRVGEGRVLKIVPPS